MASTAAPPVSSDSIDSIGLSLATASRDPDYPHRGTAYTGLLNDSAPVWFHPLNTGKYLMLMSKTKVVSSSVTQPIVVNTEPSWAFIDPSTGSQTGLGAIPSQLSTGGLTLTSAASRGDYLFLLSQTSDKTAALIQHIRVTNSGALELLGEEWVPGALGLGLYIEGNYLWVFGADVMKNLAVARRNWGRIGAATNTDPQMNWLFRSEKGWSSDVADIATIDGELPADGPVSVAKLGIKYYMMAANNRLPDHPWVAAGYVSRYLDRDWVRDSSRDVDLGKTDDLYQGGTVRLQPQLPLAPGYTLLQTNNASTALRADDNSDLVCTGLLGHTVSLPDTAQAAYTIYNQAMSPITVTTASGGTITEIPRGNALTFTAAVDAPTAAADWDMLAPSDRAPRRRSGFPYVVATTVVVGKGADAAYSWITSWGIFEV